jgi:YD repeat-containing protein
MRWLQQQGTSGNPATHDYYSSIPAGTYTPAGSAAKTTGMPTKKTDANGNPTSFSYDNTGLYLNLITYADLTFEQPHYDPSTGLLQWNYDVNLKQTQYSYDSMRRLTHVMYPDGGWETLAYSDIVGSLSVTFTKAINTSSNSSLIKKAYADGLGRLTQTQLTDPNGNVYTDTNYDSLGRVASVSSPYRSKGEATYGVTSYTYDALGRKGIVTAPDGTRKQACFNGLATVGQSNCTPANLWPGPVAWENDADENQNNWQRSQNALGQMTHVFEPNGTSSSPSMETDYAYDMLNNLLAVNQWGGSAGASGARAARSFQYDTLSRLLTSANPETGTVCYGQWSGANCLLGYDANGNLLQRTDARGIVTTYRYDNMNRLWGKSYSDNATPASYYIYGGPDPQTKSMNEAGRLIYAWTQKASQAPLQSVPVTPATTFLTMRSIQKYGYDPMGRLLGEDQYTLANQAAGTPYSPRYAYDLAGDLAYSTDGATQMSGAASLPSCGVTTPTWVTATQLSFVYCYDGAGRLQTMTGNWAPGSSGATQPLFSATPSMAQPSYAAFGGLVSAVLGNNAIAMNRTYDNRLRITGETDTGSALGTGTPGNATLTVSGAEQSQ